MPLNLQTPTPLDYFATLVQSDEHFPLLEAAASLAQDEYPEVDVQQVLGEVDQLLARLCRRLAPDAGPLQKLHLLNHFFFHDLGFAGNRNHYHDPDNSYLNVLLHTRRGIPISLAVLWMEQAQGLGLKVHGISFPGHFMLKVHLPLGLVVIDPFTGQSQSREQLTERLEPFRPGAGHGPASDLQGDGPSADRHAQDDFDAPLGLYLQAATPRDIVARMLRNLKEIHHSQQDWARLLTVQERLVRLLPEAWGEQRDRGLVHAELGDLAQAVRDLDSYLRHTQGSHDQEAVARRLAELREQLR
jgi:regulator of sirC expression with transglutaminase-like and TPR domain